MGPVAAILESVDNQNVKGELNFVNNTVNQDTSTISLKASFPNKDKWLWPGTFAHVTLHAGLSRGAVVLPPHAVLEGPTGRFVFIVGNDNTVTAKPVTLLRLQDGVAVLQGLDSGERVVLEGGQNLSSGTKVTIDSAAPTPQKPASAASASKKPV